MGALDQLAKQTFAEETEGVTRGAVTWELPPELSLSEVRLDGMLHVRDPGPLQALPAPWSQARGHAQIVFEAKMPGDHLGVRALERTLLRRQAWQVQRVEESRPAWRGQVPLWILAPRVSATLRSVRTVSHVARGCHLVQTGSFPFLWIAANELPLREELIPFLIARSGRPLDDFVRWVAPRKPPAWVLRMIQIVPMNPDLREEIARYVPVTDEPEILARQRQVAKVLIDMNPDLRDEWIKQGLEKGLEQGLEKGLEQGLEQGLEKGLAPLVHLFERRLGRNLTGDERQVMSDRLARLGADRLGDVVLDLAPDALSAWLADPAAA